MKKFKFRLASVAKERERVEGLRLREWTIVNRMMMELHSEKKKLETRLVQAINEMTEIRRASVVSTSMISETENFIQSVKLRIEWKKGEISRAEKFVERKRVEWAVARQKRKVLDKLKEKQLEDFKAEQRLKELKATDDIYIMRGAFLGRNKSEEDKGEGDL
jgi:flagellar FliJ protein